MYTKFSFFNLNKSVLALAPMDGYTDCAFREIIARYSKPDLTFTEFVNAQGLVRATDKLIEILRYTQNQRPIVGQLFGKDPKYFYQASLLLCSLGFDGIDINMGCPAKNIASKGGGAALVKNPQLACEIITSVKKAVEHYHHGKMNKNRSSDQKALLTYAAQTAHAWNVDVYPDREITVSVKTRIGYDKDRVQEWVETLSTAKPDFITIHARSVKQRFSGRADWGAIKRAVSATDIPILGNGDVKSVKDSQRMVKLTGCAGVMIGRAAIGAPWVFTTKKPKQLQSKIILEHAQLFRRYKGEKKFYEMRKHLMQYLRGFKGARKLRMKATQVSSLKDVQSLLRKVNNDVTI